MLSLALFAALGAYQTFGLEIRGCYDADTCRVDIIDSKAVGPETVVITKTLNQMVRLCDINAPEMRGVNGETKARAVAARDTLMRWLREAKKLELRLLSDSKCHPESDVCGQKDKYGRWLVWIVADGEVLNQKLVDAGLAVDYHIKCQ